MSLSLSGPVSALLSTVPILASAALVGLLDEDCRLWTVWAVNAAIQCLGYLHSALSHSERWYDACGSLGFIASVATSLGSAQEGSVRGWINSALVIAWAARLGRHLVSRIKKDSHDKRFDTMRDSGLKLALPWSMQMLWVTVLPSSVLLINTMTGSQESIGLRDVIGWLIWVVGFVTEAVADEQKKEFRSHDENRDRFIQTGLWRRSRHPNYFGEMILWFGVFISCSSAFENPIDYLTLLGPIFNCVLLRFISGVPLLEASADKKWGSSPEYQAYKSKTPLLIPKLFG